MNNDFIIRRKIEIPKMVDKHRINSIFVDRFGLTAETVLGGMIPEREELKTKIGTFYGKVIHKLYPKMDLVAYSKLINNIVSCYLDESSVFFRSTRDWRGFGRGVYEPHTTCLNQYAHKRWITKQDYFRFITLRINKGQNLSRCIAYIDPDKKYIYLLNFYSKKTPVPIGWYTYCIEKILKIEMSTITISRAGQYLFMPFYQNSMAYVLHPKDNKSFNWSDITRNSGPTIVCKDTGCNNTFKYTDVYSYKKCRTCLTEEDYKE